MLRVPQKFSRQDTRKVALCLNLNLKDHPRKMYKYADLEAFKERNTKGT